SGARRALEMGLWRRCLARIPQLCTGRPGRSPSPNQRRAGDTLGPRNMNRVCPKCHGANVRRSSTPVDEVTWRNQVYSRYRCRDCMSLFWVISRKTYMVGAALIGAIVLAIVGVLIIEIAF